MSICQLLWHHVKYHYEYGPFDYFGNIHEHVPSIIVRKSKGKNKNKQKANNMGHKGPWNSMKKQGDSQKKGCCFFTFKQFYLNPSIGEVCYVTF
jgi:hypothetical protein